MRFAVDPTAFAKHFVVHLHDWFLFYLTESVYTIQKEMSTMCSKNFFCSYPLTISKNCDNLVRSTRDDIIRVCFSNATGSPVKGTGGANEVILIDLFDLTIRACSGSSDLHVVSRLEDLCKHWSSILKNCFPLLVAAGTPSSTFYFLPRQVLSKEISNARWSLQSQTRFLLQFSYFSPFDRVSKSEHP
jgi:hypothetical protein